VKFLLVFTLLFFGLLHADQISEVNPKFIKWQQKQNIVKNQSISTSDKKTFATGWRPSPLPEVVFKSDMYRKKTRAINYPSKYDLSDPNLDGNRNDSKLSPIKDQGNCDSCWAFATYGAYEGSLKANGLSTFDFSEQHLMNNNGTEWASNPCAGGNLNMSMAYMARGSGPVLEEDDPYNIGGSSNSSAIANRYMDNIIELPIRDTENPNNTAWYEMVKNIILNKQKPIFVTMQVSSGSSGESGVSVWDDASKSYYCSDTFEQCESNHDVVIVGWDDTYEAQGQTGAFIIRNSWGLNFHNVTDGYYYVPYADKSLAFSGRVAYFDDFAESSLSFTKIYQYDTLPITSAYGSPTGTRYGANKFIITKNATVKAFGFLVMYPDTEYEIKFFTTITNNNESYTFFNQVGTTQSSTTFLPMGWHTIKLDTPFQVVAGQILIAQIKLINSSDYQLPIEADSSGYVDANSSYEESFYSQDGTTFRDLKTIYEDHGRPDANLALKVLVDETTSIRGTNPSIIMYLLN